MLAGLARLIAKPRIAVAIAVALVLTALGFGIHGFGNPLGTDYLATLTGSHLLAAHQCLYCLGSQIAVQSQLLHQGIGLPDAYFGPPALALIAQPLTLLSPQAGFALFTVLSLIAAATAAFIAWQLMGGSAGSWQRLALVALAVFSLPAAWNYWLAQWDALLLLAVMGSAVVLTHGRPVLAGIALSILVMKPQTMWLIPIVLAISGQWRVLIGALSGAAAWLVSSFALVGVDQLAQWPSLIAVRAPAVSSSIGVPGLAAMVGGDRVAVPVAIACALAGAGLCFRLRRQLSATPVLALAFGIALSFAAAPHIFAYDLVILALPICILGTLRMQAALGCAALLSAGYLVDHYVALTSAPFETLGVLLTLALLVRALAAVRTHMTAEEGIFRESAKSAATEFSYRASP